MSKTKEIKAKPPFPNLSSFGVSAQILGYLDFEHKVQSLMNCLSHNSGLYFTQHKSILVPAFLVIDHAMISGIISFGWPKKPSNCMYPDPIEIQSISKH